MSTSEQFGRTALSAFALKDALLYFRHVIPLGYTFDVLNDGLHFRSSLDTESRPFKSGAISTFIKYSKSDLIPPELRQSDFYEAMEEIGMGHLRVLFSDYWHSEDTEAGDLDLVVRNLVGPATAMLRKFSLTTLPVVSPAGFINFTPSSSADIAVTLASMELVDTNRTPLAQIYEFRRDVEATEKLRRLRIFAYENYRDKPRTFVEDDLLTRISQYDETVRKWGFETKAAVLTALLDSRLIAGGIAGSFMSSYLDSPLPAIAAALGAAGFTIGKVAIELRKQQFAYREVLANNPVSYVAYANEKLVAK